MDNETLYNIITSKEENNEDLNVLRNELLKYKLFNFNIIYNADLLTESYNVSNRFINVFNVYNSKLLEYINKSECVICNLKIVKGYGHCIKHIKNIDIIKLHNELKEIYNNLTDIQKINIKLSIAEIMVKIKTNKMELKQKINKYKQKYIISNEIINKNKDFISKNKILYKKLMRAYTYTDNERKELFKQGNLINYKYTYETDDKFLLNINQNVINICRFKQIKYEKTRLCSFFNNIDIIPNIYISNSDILIIELLKHELLSRKILYLEREKSIRINTSTYRSDIFMIIETNKYNLLPVIIETDEQHHNNNENIINNDIIKDKYFISNGYSVIHLEISNNLECKDLSITIDKLIDLIELNRPVYYFNDKYIINHNGDIGLVITKKMLEKFN